MSAYEHPGHDRPSRTAAAVCDSPVPGVGGGGQVITGGCLRGTVLEPLVEGEIFSDDCSCVESGTMVCPCRPEQGST